MLAAMPRVSEDHLEARRRQIVVAARGCFAANGFHATSMSDILRASGLSAGAVYRYFPGKEDIVIAIAEQAMSAIRQVFVNEDEDLSIGEILERAIRAVDKQADRDGLGRLALQVYAEAARSEKVRRRLAKVVRETRTALAQRIERKYGPGVDGEAVAAVVVSLLPGYVHAKVIPRGVDPDSYLRGLDDLGTLLR